MVVDITTEERMDSVSSKGYAWGYIGSCIPFLISLVFVLMYESIGISITTAMMIAFIINAAWWILFTLPLAFSYHQKYYIEHQSHVVRSTFSRLGQTLKKQKSKRKSFYSCWHSSSLLMVYIRSLIWLLPMEPALGLIQPDYCWRY